MCGNLAMNKLTKAGCREVKYNTTRQPFAVCHSFVCEGTGNALLMKG